MPSKFETAIIALQASLAGHAATVIREADLPETCPPEGLINIVPDDPREVGRHLGTGRREWEADIGLTVVMQDDTGSARNEKMDTALSSIVTLLFTDRTLGGAVDYLDLDTPVGFEVVPMPGAETFKEAVLAVTLFYETTANPME